jgi:hypothetical protein
MSDKIELTERPWGNRSGLPPREPAPDLVRDAAALRDEPEPIRLKLVQQLIFRSRSEWRGNEVEILPAAYGNEDNYWNVALAETLSLETFANLLSLHLLDPVEQPIVFAGRNTIAVAMHVSRALKRALEAAEPFFIETRRGLEVWPREAARWLLASPRYRGLVPDGLRAFLEGSAPERHALLTTAPADGPGPKFSCSLDRLRAATRQQQQREPISVVVAVEPLQPAKSEVMRKRTNRSVPRDSVLVAIGDLYQNGELPQKADQKIAADVKNWLEKHKRPTVSDATVSRVLKSLRIPQL